jgi:membrane fusion protein (multidrug efflux system)
MPASPPDSAPENSRAPTPAPEPALPPPARLSRTQTWILVILAAVVCAWLARFAYHLWKYEETDDAYASGHVHQISAQVNGQIAEVLARENQTVHAGDLLVRLDPLEFAIGSKKAAAALAEAEAAAAEIKSAQAQAEADLAQARARARQAEAQTEQARAQLALAQLTLDRDNRMAQDRALAPSELDTARADFAAASAAVRAASANDDSLKAGVLAATARREAALAQAKSAAAAIDLAQAAAQDAQRQLSYVEIRSPADGRIGNKNVEIGNRIQIGQTLMVVVEPEIWFEANYKETQLAHIRAGQPAEVKIDAIPDHTFTGRVESVAPASGAEFALLPADNATGNFTKVVQRVPVKIVLTPSETEAYSDRIRPGLSAVVNVQIR